MDANITSYNNGYWSWDELSNCLMFISRDSSPKTTSAIKTTTTSITGTSKPQGQYEIKFHEITDKLEKIIFRRYFQRRCKLDEPEVVTIQDVKDIALYLANPKDLTVEFITFFHIPTVDRFLRALILYFQYFLDIWEYMLERRIEESRKLRQPVVIELENVIKDDLGDLRSMLAREYLSLIGGLEDAAKFHHMSTRNNDSLSDKDRRIFEMLICMSARVVWVALQRKHLTLIELEMGRIFRSDFFNIIVHRRQVGSFKRSAAEDRVMMGLSNKYERKLLQRSPLVKELMLGEHDHRMLGAGFKNFQPSDERIRYLEAAYAAPEELLLGMGVTVGVLGIPRDEYDPVLMTRERTSKTFNKPPIEVPPFKIPSRAYHGDEEVPQTFPVEPCKYKETEQTKLARITQCKMWQKHVKKILEGGATPEEMGPSGSGKLTHMDSNISSINNGYWSWDENCNSLVFLSRDPTLTSPSTMKSAGITRSSKQEVQYEVKFYEITDKLEKIILRRYFQRRCRLGEPEVITIQDVKDISTEFINFFHIPTVWEYMLQKRADKSRKLSSLIANELENITSDDLADLRSMLGIINPYRIATDD
ncbi:hypothetical protein Trydic_g13152 [Trypoxylus dichotomus]